MNAAIQVEGLGKKYRITHLARQSYGALRDVIADGFKKIVAGNSRSPAPYPREEEFWALRDVSFKVGVGERVGIIGRNGAGKSTLLKLLSRITAPTTGRISLKGRVASLLEVGTGFHPELTGRENVYVNGAILGMPRSEIRRKFDEIVAFASIEQFLDTPVKRYSSGMYMRLAFAVAAHLEPEILLVDEVLAVGDAEFQAKCLGKMESISSEGRTVLFVSHNMSAVATLCERAILLQKGREAMDGSVDAVISHYLETTPSAESLTTRTDRSGTGHARVTAIEFRDPAGATSRTLMSRQALEIVLDMDVAREALGKSVSVILVICDRADTRLFSLYSEWQRSDLAMSKEKERFICSVPQGFPLIPDHYSMIVGVLVNGIVADKISNAVQFEVVSKDLFGTGTVPSIGFGPIVVNHSWAVIS
jgi:lipopolysaccharide transport system ATP-binding protein